MRITPHLFGWALWWDGFAKNRPLFQKTTIAVAIGPFSFYKAYIG